VLAVSAALPDEASDRPAVVLIHGAANSARVWTFWQQELVRRGWPAYALDLRGHGASTPLDLSRTTMTDYAADVSALVRQLAAAPVVMGWSMGGLAALIAAARGGALAYVGLAPSPPARARHTSPTLRSGVFGAEEYGIVSGDPGDQPAMPDLDLEERSIALASLGPESRHARDDRRAGIVIADLPCPAFIVTGSADPTFPRRTYDDLPLAAEFLEAEGASHWGLVLNRRILATLIPTVAAWMEKKAAGR
jgi:pimeloyl-ACP methyl ester carboxylesterase